MENKLEKFFDEQQKTLEEVLERVLKQANFPADSVAISQGIHQAITALAQHNQKVFQHVADNLAAPAANAATADTVWDISTALVPLDEVKIFETKGFKAMPNWFDGTANTLNEKERHMPLEDPLFLNVAYNELDDYLNKKYTGEFQGEPFTYELRSFNGYCEAEKHLAAIADLYGLKRPLVFSPWARRAVWLDMPAEIRQAGDYDNLRLEENGLAEVLITRHLLMWNVDLTEFEDNQSSSAAPDAENPLYKRIFKNCDQKTFILPRFPEQNHVDFAHVFLERLAPEKIIFYAPKEISKECLRMEIKDVLPGISSDQPVFSNKFNLADVLKLERVRTKGELNILFKALSNDVFTIELSEKPGKGWPHYQSSRHHAYPDMDKHNLQQGQKTPVYFTCKTKNTDYMKFIPDYAEYVWNYLKARYPEFDWRSAQND